MAYPQNLAVVIGNEARGVHPSFRQRADLVVRIPLVGPVESLNASVAAGCCFTRSCANTVVPRLILCYNSDVLLSAWGGHW